VADVVGRQRELGIDIVNDGEYGHSMGERYDDGAWWSYVFPRLGALELTDVALLSAPQAYKRFTRVRVEALNHAIRGLPPERIRFHLCWGAGTGRAASVVASTHRSRGPSSTPSRKAPSWPARSSRTATAGQIQTIGSSPARQTPRFIAPDVNGMTARPCRSTAIRPPRPPRSPTSRSALSAASSRVSPN
jgi:hypothetical protein